MVGPTACNRRPTKMDFCLSIYLSFVNLCLPVYLFYVNHPSSSIIIHHHHHHHHHNNNGDGRGGKKRSIPTGRDPGLVGQTLGPDRADVAASLSGNYPRASVVGECTLTHH